MHTRFKKIILIFTFITICTFAKSQNINNDFALAQQNIASYKDWISHSWLKDQIKYDTLEKVANKLYLTLLLVCKEDCKEKWNKLKLSFDTLSKKTFEEYLFNKSSFLLEVPQDLLVVEIYNSADLNIAPCFLRSILFNNSIIITSTDCKVVNSKTEVDYQKFHPTFSMKKWTHDAVDRKYKQILDTVFEKAKKYYSGRGSFYKISSTNSTISFEIRGLNNEVIPKSAIFSFKTIEVLRFTISCIAHSYNMEFETNVDGKYGSNIFKPTTEKGYKDMEVEYKTELQNYVSFFTSNLIPQWLR